MIAWRRVAQEKRSLLVPLVMAAVVNVAVYFLVVYPLTARTSSLEARAQTAAVAAARAQSAFRAAEAARTGRSRADVQLARFYTEVLPRDYVAARRITYLRLAKLALDSSLEYDQRDFHKKSERESTLEQLEGTMSLSGDYQDMRRFIHALDTAPEFVIIKSVSLAQGEGDAPLTLSLHLATYYRVQP